PGLRLGRLRPVQGPLGGHPAGGAHHVVLPARRRPSWGRVVIVLTDALIHTIVAAIALTTTIAFLGGLALGRALPATPAPRRKRRHRRGHPAEPVEAQTPPRGCGKCAPNLRLEDEE